MSKRPDHVNDLPQLGETARLPLRKTEWFDDALRGIGEPMSKNRARLASRLQTFENAWARNTSFEELRNKPFQCKQVWDSQACKRYKVYQLTVNRELRVWFTVVPALNAAFYLDVEHKQGTSQSSNAIARCCRRARTKWEERPK